MTFAEMKHMFVVLEVANHFCREVEKKRKWGWWWWYHILQISNQPDATDPLRALIRNLAFFDPKLQCQNINPDPVIRATNMVNHGYEVVLIMMNQRKCL